MIRLSVVIPTYNAGKFIDSTIKSILREIDLKIDEIIIIDDCSVDETVEIINKFRENFNNIFLSYTERNSGGPAHPRNLGIQLSRGKYIAFCDADDLWIEGKLKSQLKYIETADVVCTSKIYFNEKDNNKVIKNAKLSSKRSYKKLSLISFLVGNPVVNSSVLCKKHSIQNYKFNVNRSYAAVEDYDMWLRLKLSSQNFILLNKNYVMYRTSDQQISRSKINMTIKVFKLYSDHFGIIVAVFLINCYIINHILRNLKKLFIS